MSEDAWLTPRFVKKRNLNNPLRRWQLQIAQLLVLHIKQAQMHSIQVILMINQVEALNETLI